jgi:hypothetical protein
MSGDFPGGNPRVPPPYEGIQVNFCKNVECGHFCRPASPERQPRGPDRSGRGDLLSAVTTEGLPKNEEAFAFLQHVK